MLIILMLAPLLCLALKELLDWLDNWFGWSE